MLGDNKSKEALLGTSKSSSQINARSSPSPAQRISVNNQKIQNSDSNQVRQSLKTQKSRRKKQQRQDAQFTTVLKFLNIIIGLGVIGFGVSCYYFFQEDTAGLSFLKVILPGYIAFSGLIILLIQCNIGFMIKNMKFLYNFIGRGLFNIYVGIMPLSMIKMDDPKQKGGIFQILVFVIVSLMCLVGVLYIIAKIFCCAKQSNKKRRRKNSSDSDDY